jgi:TetR/AcrR family acrAB operon transcriptional repressor
MARKTKEDANLTRQLIIDAAREVFVKSGVSRTSLEHIAKQAGVTRGAVYWHFESKTDIVQAMREQVFLPLIDRMDDTLLSNIHTNNENQLDALSRLENFMLATVHELANNLITKQTYIIMMTKCEYVGQFEGVLQEILNNCNGIINKIEAVYQKALDENLLQPTLTASELAMDTHLFFSGLLHMWVKDDEGNHFRHRADDLIKMHIKLKRRVL